MQKEKEKVFCKVFHTIKPQTSMYVCQSCCKFHQLKFKNEI